MTVFDGCLLFMVKWLRYNGLTTAKRGTGMIRGRKSLACLLSAVAVVSTVLRSAAVGSVAAAAVVRAAEVVSLEPLLSLSSLEQALRVSAAAAAVTMAMVFVVKDFNSSPWLLWCVRLASRLASRSAFHGTRGSSLMRSLSKSDVFHCNPAEHLPLSHPPVCSLAWVLWHAWVHD